jgi:hypothetical protein
MDQARFLQLVGAELHRRGVPGYRIKDSGRRARLSLHSQLGHLAVKPYRNGKLKVEICCDGENAVDAMRALAPIRHELEACIGQPGHEEHIDGAHRVRWTIYREVDPSSEWDALHWAVDFLEAGWRRMARHRPGLREVPD